jgi:L,D-peptidoglycan transpeptidase YkuD (ErfK/YbiS/YcfS/YnhG family)
MVTAGKRWTIRVLALAAAGIALHPGAAGARSASCPANLASTLASTGAATQLVTVVAPSTAATQGSLSLWQRSGPCWRLLAGPWAARLGFGGLSAHHVEGDGTTPVGAFQLGPVVYGVAPDPGVRFAYHRLVCGDWWDEDPASPTYNTFQHVACGTRPRFGGGSEALWTATRAYRFFLVLEYNTRPVVPDRGSGIFLHADLGHPTNGCVSLPPARLVTLLRRLAPAAKPLVAIGTRDEIRHL